MDSPAHRRIREARETLGALRRLPPGNRSPSVQDIVYLHEVHALHERAHGRGDRALAAEGRARRALARAPTAGRATGSAADDLA